MTEIKHTPLPWHYIDEWRGIYDSTDLRGAQVRIAEITSTPDYKTNAEFIVRACNSHYDLVKQLEIAVYMLARHKIDERPSESKKCDKMKRLLHKIDTENRQQALNKAKGVGDDTMA